MRDRTKLEHIGKTKMIFTGIRAIPGSQNAWFAFGKIPPACPASLVMYKYDRYK